MNLLPPEVQLDIFKCLNFQQLFNIQQTNSFYRDFVKEYEQKLAMMELFKLDIFTVNEINLNKYKFIKLDPKFYEFELSEEQENKWINGLKNSIPMFLKDDDTNVFLVISVLKRKDDFKIEALNLQFPIIPKNIEEMKISRYLFQQFSNCVFEQVCLDTVVFNCYFKLHQFIFNPQMLEILYENRDKTKNPLPLQIHSREAKLQIYKDYDHNSILKFAFNHLISNKLKIRFADGINIEKEKYQDVLFTILTTGGNQFFEVRCKHPKLSGLHELIIKHKETLTDTSNMVKEIIFEDSYGSEKRIVNE